MAKKKSAPKPSMRKLPIKWHVADGLNSHYATHIVAQRGEHEYILSFFEIHPPMLLGNPDTGLEQLDQVDSIEAECVARIIVSAEKFGEFVKVLQDLVARGTLSKEEDKA